MSKPVALYFMPKGDQAEFERHWRRLGINCEFRERAHGRVWEYSFRASYPDGSQKWCVWSIVGPAHWQADEARRRLLDRAADRGFCAVHVYKERRASTDEEVKFIREFNRQLAESREACLCG